jgi:translocation and assembly module TamB
MALSGICHGLQSPRPRPCKCWCAPTASSAFRAPCGRNCSKASSACAATNGIDRATIILPDESAPSLGSDVVVRSAATDRAQAQAARQGKRAQAQTAKPPDIALTLNLGNDFALSGHGITTRLTGEIDIQSSTTPGAPPRVTGEVQTQQGRYRAWGQMLDVETGLIRFNGPYNNPSLDILALRPNISVRAGVQVTGSALAPRVKLYSDPELPDAEKLSWVVLGRSAAGGGAEAAVLQQAALALLGRGGTNNTAANAARRLGLDEIGFKGPGTGDDATGAALTFGKRLSKDLYVTYERSLSGTLGTLYIFYDLDQCRDNQWRAAPFQARPPSKKSSTHPDSAAQFLAGP